MSRVYFRPRASDHQRAVTCRAENTNIRGSAIEDTIRVTVNCESQAQLYNLPFLGAMLKRYRYQLNVSDS